MLPFLEPFAAPCPAWLRRLTPGQIAAGPLPFLDRLVDGALLYPGGDLDGSPVRQLNGVLHSFVFMDYGTAPEALEAEATKARRSGTGFAHHRLVGLTRFDPAPILARVPPELHHPDTARWARQAPWGLWGVWEDLRPERRGERFSLLFLGAEAHACIAALYPEGSRPPAAVVVQEHGFGGNVRRSHAEPLEGWSARWTAPPELLITGENAWHLPWWERLTELGSDRAPEAMHQNLRIFRQVRREPGEPPARHFPAQPGDRFALGPALRRLLPRQRDLHRFHPR